MGTNCVPLLAGLFLNSYEVEFIQNLLHEKKKSLAVAFKSTFRYIDDVLSIKSFNFIYIPMNWKSKTPQSFLHLLRI
jgi:hypothetical protein